MSFLLKNAKLFLSIMAISLTFMSQKTRNGLIVAVLVVSLFIAAFAAKEFIGGTSLPTNNSTSTPQASPTLSTSLSSQPTFSPSPSMSPSPTATASAADYLAQCQKDLAEAKTFDEKTRNITLNDANVVVVSQAWAIQTWGEGGAAPDIVDINRTERIYKGLFLMPENASLYQATVDWAGYFISAVWNGQIYVITENFNPWSTDAAATFAHELTHIMQGQYYGNVPQYQYTFDAAHAHTALIEGDANYMESLFQNATKTQTTTAPSPKPQPPIPWNLVSDPMLATIQASIPNSVADFDYFPYTYGPNFISALYNQGGWSLVDKAYSDPPNTTQQILQPEKYFQGADAQQIQPPTLSETGWVQEKTDSYGEYLIQDMLGNWIPKIDAQNVASSWSGDKLNYYERQNDYLFTWKIQWNSTNAASAFATAFQKMMTATNATQQDNGDWYANGRYLLLKWDPTLNTTVIVCSTNETSTLQTLT